MTTRKDTALTGSLAASAPSILSLARGAGSSPGAATANGGSVRARAGGGLPTRAPAPPTPRCAGRALTRQGRAITC
jgi:hypothetical protein